MHKKFLLWMLVLFLYGATSLSFVSALGISPGRTFVDFTPNMEQTVTLTVVNTDHRDLDIILYAEGELASFIALSEEKLHFTKDEQEKKVTYTARLPVSLGKPGMHSGRIIAREISSSATQEEEIVVRALIAVASAFDVRVPYPGKYVVPQLYIDGTQEKQPVSFLIQAHNFGTNDIFSAQTSIALFDEQQRLVTTLLSEEIPIPAGKRVEFLQFWNANVSYGQYAAQATISYDGQTTVVDQSFSVGTFALEPLEISVKDFSLGDVAKFNILVKNRADQDVQRATGSITLYDLEGNVAATFSSVDTLISASSVKALLAYWDTEQTQAGTYEGKLILTADDTLSEHRLRTTVTENQITTEFVALTGQVVSSSSLRNTLLRKEASYTLITVAIISINVLVWYIYVKRRTKKKIMDDF